ncbi:hypothetical protein [Xylella fastidiosa]|uniref:YkgJ family cysteine cluster protein n=1 Tax=Xylella fastidiosa subsp. sandyi Ann-1 TaxID=155920 RepID=A0A060H8A4_XYLFS|nr:hypothetical protein [Xylella fastidiosa]AIC11545.1 hypothetical protein D934_10810 [Xylella fastidiosa subsp. sandyi Ann-1]UIX80703.1 hypothetical protein LZ756_09455 [Xylella fastidiosa subsp. sandyi]
MFYHKVALGKTTACSTPICEPKKIAHGKISERNIEVARKNVRKNIQRLNKKLSNKVKNEEAALPDIIAGTHGTPIEKLLALYKLSDPIFTAIRPFTACRYGCSACCHYKVELLPIEAELIAISLGQAPLPLPTTFQNVDIPPP